MYSLSNVSVNKMIPQSAVEKGLGFDFSAISDFVKTAATTGLNIYKQQATIQQTKALAASNPYGVPIQTLPFASPYLPALTSPQYGQPYVQPYVQQPSMIDTSTMLMIGGLVVGGIVLFKVIKG